VATYRVGDALPYRLNVVVGNTTRTVQGATGGLALPAAAFSGMCTAAALPLMFGRNVPAAHEYPYVVCVAPTTHLVVRASLPQPPCPSTSWADTSDTRMGASSPVPRPQRNVLGASRLLH
jgi:hypothetical protein